MRTTIAVVVGAVLLAGCGPAGTGTTKSKDPAAHGSYWTMPMLVGVGLQLAQDTIQELTGDPVFLTSSHDATGAGRHQVLDSDWRVCTQNIAPGTRFTKDTTIDFGVVKRDEHCPGT